MAQIVSVTASTASAQTGTLALDPTKRSTTVMLNTVVGSSNATVQVEYSLNDPSELNAPTATWALLSSATAIASSNTDGLSWTVLSPIAQVRINSTTGSTGTAPVFTLTALQSITA